MMMKLVRSTGWVAALFLVSGTAVAQQPAGKDWPTYGGNAWNQRYSGLTAINTKNVNQLVPRSILQTGIPEASRSLPCGP